MHIHICVAFCAACFFLSCANETNQSVVSSVDVQEQAVVQKATISEAARFTALAQNHYTRGNLAEALDDYGRAIEVDPKHADAYYRRGLLKNELGNFTSAIDDFNAAMRLDKSFAARCYNERGYAKYMLKRYNEAIADYSISIELYPKSANTWFNRAEAKKKTSDIPGALADYESCAKLESNNVFVYISMGILHEKLRNYVLAEENFTRAISIKPDYAQSYLARAKIRHILDNTNGALADYSTSIQLDKNEPTARIFRAKLYADMGMNDKAEDDLRLAGQL